MSVHAFRRDVRCVAAVDTGCEEREALLRFLAWAEGVAENLGEDDAVAGLRHAASAIRCGDGA